MNNRFQNSDMSNLFPMLKWYTFEGRLIKMDRIMLSKNSNKHRFVNRMYHFSFEHSKKLKKILSVSENYKIYIDIMNNIQIKA